MKLAGLGVIVLVLGIVLSIPGLIAAGGLWIPLGLVVRAHAHRVEEAREVQKRAAEAGAEEVEPVVDGPTFALGALLLLAVGLPSLAIGFFEVGFDAADSDWRWIPIAIGGLATAIAVISSLMFMLGSGLEATAEAIGVPEHPATITIRSVRETGVYVNERPRLEFELTVQPEGLPAYEVAKKATVPHTALGSIRPGDGFQALVLPEKPEKMEIDWSSPIPGADGSGADPSERLEELEELRREGTITPDEYEQQRRRILDSI